MTTTTEPTLHHIFTDLPSLKRAYMPFVIEGAIFIPTEKNFQLNDSVTASITLPENNQEYTFTGEIIWVSPIASHHPGIGITCSGDEGQAFRKAVADLIGEVKGGEREGFDTM